MRTRTTTIGGLLASILVALMLAPVPSAAVPLPPLPGEDPTPTPSPTPTQDPSPDPEPTRDPKPEPKPSSKPDGGSSSSGGSSSGSSTRKLSTQERQGLKEWLTRERTDARTTTRLLTLIEEADEDGEVGGAQRRAAFGRFPIVGYTWYQDDYGAPRFRGHYVFHAGTDLFAERGTPVIAVADGQITRMGYWSVSGNAIWLAGDDGVRYYFGHFDRLNPDLRTGSRVRQGDLLGWVGNTGSAAGTYPHVHFEVNPGGRGTVNPKPLLDRWLDEAEAAVEEMVDTMLQRRARAPMGAARWDTLFDLIGEAGAPHAATWTAGLDGSATLGQLDAALSYLSLARDWSDAVDFGEARRVYDRLGELAEHMHDDND